MKTTLIAVSYGEETDPYTCSSTIDDDNVGLDVHDAVECRDMIAKLQQLPINSIDEVLVIQDSEVIEQHGGEDGF